MSLSGRLHLDHDKFHLFTNHEVPGLASRAQIYFGSS